MQHHPALTPGRAAVITGGASGIGLATAQRLAAMGMHVCIADTNAPALQAAARQVENAGKGRSKVVAQLADVSLLADVQQLKNVAYDAFGEVAFLMNNAGVGGNGDGVLGSSQRWQQILAVNLWGVVHGTQAFVPAMLAQGTQCAVVNTGSKQGITCPPGHTAYNVSKAGVKITTEALAHELRNIPGCRISAHLLIPGFVYTTLTANGRTTKPDAAWLPEQVADFLLDKMGAGDFYILCPDNDANRATDEKRMAWAMDDIIRNRPPLSRWHPDYKEQFAQFLREDEEQVGG